jgi:hypothetical protein
VLTLDDLTGNGTVAGAGAHLLREIGAGVQPFIVYSLPRNAGKSTVTEAILAAAPDGTPRHDFLGTEAERDELQAAVPSGYLVVAEMGHRGRPGYLAGDEIVRAFELVDHGYPLATSLHADDLAGAFAVLTGNGVGLSSVAKVRWFVKVQPLGDPFDPATRRIVEHVHEVAGLDAAGAPRAELRYEAPSAT